jgi:hypothetical protein
MFIPFKVIGDQCLPYRCINNTPSIDKNIIIQDSWLFSGPIAEIPIQCISQRVLNSPYYLPVGKVDDTASPLLSRVRGRIDYSFTLDASDLRHPRLSQR